ncbi:hypothetical protein DO64_5344 [Burkholderia pseudomallei]|nr:hypothetical protein DO64_5344 [Burkholderia pseudomallei]KGS65079.1 hypothetical protein X990_4339 [Burkholderia pseudomallei MSHR4868]
MTLVRYCAVGTMRKSSRAWPAIHSGVRPRPHHICPVTGLFGGGSLCLVPALALHASPLKAPQHQSIAHSNIKATGISMVANPPLQGKQDRSRW